MKTCTLCLIEKPLDEFYRKGKSYKSQCKKCCSEYGKKYYEKNKETHNQTMKKHYLDNKDKYTETHKKYRNENSEKILKIAKNYNKKRKEVDILFRLRFIFFSWLYRIIFFYSIGVLDCNKIFPVSI